MPVKIVKTYRIICDYCGAEKDVEILLNRLDDMSALPLSDKIKENGWIETWEDKKIICLCPSCQTK